MSSTYMDRIRTIQAKVRAFIPLTEDDMETIRAYAKAYVEAKGDATTASYLAQVTDAQIRAVRAHSLHAYIAAYLAARSSLGNHDPAGHEAERAFNAWWAACGERNARACCAEQLAARGSQT